MGNARLGIVILAVGDLPRAVRFYREAFGWLQQVDAQVYAEFRMANALRFGVYQREGFGKNTGRVPYAVPAGELAPTELYFYVDDPTAAVRRVVDAGGQLLSTLAPRDWGDEVAYCADPEGHVLALARTLPVTKAR